MDTEISGASGGHFTAVLSQLVQDLVFLSLDPVLLFHVDLEHVQDGSLDVDRPGELTVFQDQVMDLRRVKHPMLE